MTVKAVQQFQLRSVIRSEKEAISTLTKMKEAGYDGIELCSYMIQKMSWKIRLLTRLAGMPMGNSGKLDWLSIIERTGLTVVSIHQDLGSVMSRTEEVVREAKAFGTQYIVITGMHHFDFSNLQEVKKLAEQLNTAGEKLSQEGLSLLYHNHNCELRKVGSDRTALDVLIKETNPKFVNFELDSYWLAEAGVDPVKVMDQLGVRMKLYHINDRGSRVQGKKGSILKSDSMELGTGNMNLNAMVDRALFYGVEAIVLETHRNWINKSPIQSFELSALFLNRYV